MVGPGVPSDARHSRVLSSRAYASFQYGAVGLRAPESLIAELETAVSGSSDDKRQKTLKRVTELFVENAERFNDDHVDVFDDVLLYLIKQVEAETNSEVGKKLAPVDNAPFQVIQHLARHDDATVAAPVLAASNQLADHDLTEIAATKSDGHVSAIARRATLVKAVTDIIVERGDRDSVQALVANVNATFSEKGFQKLVERAENDAGLTEQVGMRLDIPSAQLKQLLTKASEDVQSRLSAYVPLDSRDEIFRIVSAISMDAERGAMPPGNFKHAEEVIRHLQEKDQFSESSILEFAKMNKYEEMIAGLSALCSAPVALVHRLMQGVRNEGLLILCKANGMQWLTVGAILTNRFSEHSVAVDELRKAKIEYNKLTVGAAQKIFKFFLLRATPPKVAQGKSRPSHAQPAKEAPKEAAKAPVKRGLGKVPLRHAG